MSNTLATNAVVTNSISTKYSLKSTKEGFPLNKQVPRTYQRYSGTGNQTVTYDGSNDFVIVGSSLIGPLIITLGPDTALRNWVGRTCNVHILGGTASTVTINASPALIQINGTALTQLTHVIPGDSRAKCVVISFLTPTLISVDYGVSAGSVVPATPITVTNVGAGAGIWRNTVAPSSIFLKSITNGYTMSVVSNPNDIAITSTTFMDSSPAIHLPYGHGSVISAPIGFNPIADSLDVIIEPLSLHTEGLISPFFTDTTVSGFTPAVNIQLDPCPRKLDTTIIPITLYTPSTTDIRGNSKVKIIYDAANVFDKEYILGSDKTNQLFMYEPLVFPPGIQRAADVFSVPVDMGGAAHAIAANIQDNYIFFAEIGGTRVFIKSLSTNSYGGGYGTHFLFDVATVNGWAHGATISDMDYDEDASVLYILPDILPSKLLSVPIYRYNGLNTGVVEIGPIACTEIGLDPTYIPQCIAVNRHDKSIYISHIELLNNRSIVQFASFSAMTSTIAFTFTGYTAGRFSLTFGSLGRLYNTNDFDGFLRVMAYGRNLAEGFDIMYTLPDNYKSLTRNLYNFVPV